MYIHRPDPSLSTAENLLKMLRPDQKYTDLEAHVLDIALLLHMEHGGGNNSTFTTHVVTSSGSDTYSVVAAALASLKGPKHGGANIKVVEMMADLKQTLQNPHDEGQVADYLHRLLNREAFDRKGLIYGMGPQKLAQELKIPLSEAKAFMARYFERLQGLKHFYENVEEMAREQGYVTTLAGRRRPLPDIQAESQQARSLARRQAINTLIQGSAADIIKLAMLGVHGDETLRTLDAKLLLQVHDELLLEVPEAAAQEAGERVAALMANVRPGGIVLDVPLKADWGAAENWGDAH